VTKPKVTLTLAILTLTLAGAAWHHHATTTRLRTLASHLIPACPLDDIRLVSSTEGDTFEQHDFNACGRLATMVCQAPDFQCFLLP
jgi:hypothetical protein